MQPEAFLLAGAALVPGTVVAWTIVERLQSQERVP